VIKLGALDNLSEADRLLARRVYSALTFGKETGGVVKGIEFSVSVARRLASRI